MKNEGAIIIKMIVFLAYEYLYLRCQDGHFSATSMQHETNLLLIFGICKFVHEVWTFVFLCVGDIEFYSSGEL
jgi:hypothetical protein